MDEVDDTRTTLKYCVEEVMRTNAPAAIAVAVVHNKLKPKDAELPPGVVYMAGEDVPPKWNCYPWDAAAYGRDIYQHEKLAAECAGEGNVGAPPSRSLGNAGFCLVVGLAAGLAVGIVIARR